MVMADEANTKRSLGQQSKTITHNAINVGIIYNNNDNNNNDDDKPST